MLEIRKKKNLKYSDTSLPESHQSKRGFHPSCYQRFTALPKSIRKKIKEEESQTKKTQKPVTRSSNILPQTSSSGVYDQVCIFCNKKDKKFKGTKQKLIQASSTAIQESINRQAKLLNDNEMLLKVQGQDFVSKEVLYHQICRTNYQNRTEKHISSKKLPNKDIINDTEWHISREIHAHSFESLCSFIDESVIENKNVHATSEVNNIYLSILADKMSCNVDNITSTTQKLEEKLISKYKDRIKIMKGKTKRGSIIFSSEMNVEEAFRRENSSQTKFDMQLKQIAYKIREAIMLAEHRPIRNFTPEKIIEGEITTPLILENFMTALLCGPDNRVRCSDRKKRRVKAICQDTIYACTNGRKVPSKHLQLGIAVKKLTGSKRLIEILNRLGHSISYNAIEETETEMTYQVTNSETITPSEIKKSGNLCTGVAFDNFDRYVETLSGKDTLHDTVGIVYQNVSNMENHESAIDNTPSEEPNTKSKKRRAYEGISFDIEPYHKKPKMNKKKMLPLNDQRRKDQPLSIQNSKILDLKWMINFGFNDTKTPMWVGWNSQNTVSVHDEKQHIAYLPQINHSPTSSSVVKKTMEIALKIAKECQKKEIAVTYDLAIAKVAMQIQAEEAPMFDKLFINLGAFHIELALLGVLGKYLDASGGPFILNECHIIEKGSMNSFISGKNYKRGIRAHSLLSLSMEILHFKQFLKSKNMNNSEDIENLIKDIQFNTLPDQLKELLKEYEIYREDTANGKHGLTAKFWIGYVNIVKLYRLFNRSVRTGDFQLYLYCLPKLSEYFFVFNHLNYARWILRYHDNLLQLSTSHPEILTEFEKGNFSVRRTNKNFSRLPVDLTLEQTINADAACQRVGIISLTNSISARQRWAQGHSVCTAILSNLFTELKLTRKEDITKELQPNCIKRNVNDVEIILDFIEETRNPFHEHANPDTLFNISTGKSASAETKYFLMNVNTLGKNLRENFIKKCVEDPSKFEEQLTRQKMKTFATERKIYQLSNTEKKAISASMLKDMFGAILRIALEKRVDMATVLTYPLTPVPLSLCHVDGKMQKTPKAKLLQELESRVIHSPPKNVDIVIVDGMFFLHLLVELPQTFGSTASFILKKLCNLKGRIIYMVFDKNYSPSIKDVERDDRCSERHELVYSITGPEQKRPGDWLKALGNDSFKKTIAEFLIQEWERNYMVPFFNNKELYVNLEDKCFHFKVENNNVKKEEIASLYCRHEEADTRMVFYALTVNQPSNIVFRTVDTDVLIILLANLTKFNSKSNIWIEAGIYTKNTQRYINVRDIGKSIGESVCVSLPALHAFTGCDYTSSFSRKGKIKPLKLLEKIPTFQEAFGFLGSQDEVPEDVMKKVNTFVCQLYGQKKATSVNDARFDIFMSKYKSKNANQLNFQKKLDTTHLPPCEKVLLQKIKRVNYIAQIWKNVEKINTVQADAEHHGWKLIDGKYELVWFDGLIAPNIDDVVASTNDEVLDEDDEGFLFYFI